ncbi:MAG: hypothetical protein K2Y40_08645 [Reyranella sp.]|nr:hypothetical protein [Reyranella sp.]
MTADLSFAEVRRAVIAALERAADTLQRLPIPRNGRPALEQSPWQAILMASAGIDPCSSSDTTRIPPRAEAISELDRVLPWLRPLDAAERRIVWARAGGVPWPRLAREFGVSVGRLRYRWEAAIDRVVAAAVQDALQHGSLRSGRRRSCQTGRLGR